MLDMLIPEQTVLSSQQITIGKIYAAKLIYESFKEIKRRKNCTLPQFAVSLDIYLSLNFVQLKTDRCKISRSILIRE